MSVVVPARNEELVLGACLEALDDQSDPIDEIIVVDNDSTDNTAALADSRAEDQLTMAKYRRRQVEVG